MPTNADPTVPGSSRTGFRTRPDRRHDQRCLAIVGIVSLASTLPAAVGIARKRCIPRADAGLFHRVRSVGIIDADGRSWIESE